MSIDEAIIMSHGGGQGIQKSLKWLKSDIRESERVKVAGLDKYLSRWNSKGWREEDENGIIKGCILG